VYELVKEGVCKIVYMTFEKEISFTSAYKNGKITSDAYEARIYVQRHTEARSFDHCCSRKQWVLRNRCVYL